MSSDSRPRSARSASSGVISPSYSQSPASSLQQSSTPARTSGSTVVICVPIRAVPDGGCHDQRLRRDACRATIARAAGADDHVAALASGRRRRAARPVRAASPGRCRAPCRPPPWRTSSAAATRRGVGGQRASAALAGRSRAGSAKPAGSARSGSRSMPTPAPAPSADERPARRPRRRRGRARRRGRGRRARGRRPHERAPVRAGDDLDVGRQRVEPAGPRAAGRRPPPWPRCARRATRAGARRERVSASKRARSRAAEHAPGPGRAPQRAVGGQPRVEPAGGDAGPVGQPHGRLPGSRDRRQLGRHGQRRGSGPARRSACPPSPSGASRRGRRRRARRCPSARAARRASRSPPRR